MEDSTKPVQLPKAFLQEYPNSGDWLKRVIYARDHNRNPVGVIVMDYTGNVGFSMLNRRVGDKWDRVEGLRVAINRCIAHRATLETVKVYFMNKPVNCSEELTENIQAMYRACITLEEHEAQRLNYLNRPKSGTGEYSTNR